MNKVILLNHKLLTMKEKEPQNAKGGIINRFMNLFFSQNEATICAKLHYLFICAKCNFTKSSPANPKNRML